MLVSLIGFWEWRSALLMALSIPVTLAMTFGMMSAIGLDLQQMSIASLIIALGLLVDDPVVAGDAIKRELGVGHPKKIAAWLGPTKLANAILFATITNIVAYVPYMLIPGDTGQFLYSLPVVIGCSLVASRLVSMTFIPLLGYYLLKPKLEPTIEQRKQSGFASLYYRFGQFAIQRRWAFLTGLTVVVIGGGVALGAQLKTQYFPTDLQYLSYVDVWLSEDAPLAATQETTEQVEAIIRRVAAEYGQHHGDDNGQPREVLRSLTTFIGGGAPRFWYSVAPEQSQLNYSQVVIEVFDKHDSRALSGDLQEALNREIAGARIDVRQLETGAPVGIPVSVRIVGEDIATLRHFAAQATAILRDTPYTTGVRDNWGPESMTVRLTTDTDRANMSNVTNADVAGASSTAISGAMLTTLREGSDQIPVMARLRMEERAALSDIRNLYVYSSSGPQKLPLEAIATLDYGMQSEKLQRRNQFRTITVSAFPAGGHLSSEVLMAAMPKFKELEQNAAAGLSLRDRRRVRRTGLGIPRPDDGDGAVGRHDLPGAGDPVPPRDQAVRGVRSDSLWLRRRAGHVVVDGRAVRVHGIPRHRQPGRRDRQPHHRAVRLHRGDAPAGQAARTGAARGRHRPVAAGDDHRGRDRDCPVSAGGARRPAVGADVLRADWRPDRGHLCDAHRGAGALRDLCARPEDHQVGHRAGGLMNAAAGVTVAVGVWETTRPPMTDSEPFDSSDSGQLRRLMALDALLPTLSGVLDVREVFVRISEITKQVLPHDIIGITLLEPDGIHATVHAMVASIQPQVPRRIVFDAPEMIVKPWDHVIVDDTHDDPVERERPAAKAGCRSVLRLPLREDSRFIGIFAFGSSTPRSYRESDVVVGKRIAAHVQLALSHARLAEERERMAKLRERATTMELLDEVLSAVTGSGELPVVWDRISAVAQKVLPHDALLLSALLPDGVRGRVYASKAPGSAPFAEYVTVPPAVINNPEWEYDLVEDLQSQPDQKNLESTRLGYRSALRIPLRLDGEFVAAVSFLSFTPSAYRVADVQTARRIGDRLVQSFARERRLALRKQADEASERASRLEARVRELTDELDSRTGYRRVVGESAKWREILTQATQVASTETTALLLGESGTGKEVVARFLHRASQRKNGPFVALNCAALPGAAARSRVVRIRTRRVYGGGEQQTRPARTSRRRHAASR